MPLRYKQLKKRHNLVRFISILFFLISFFVSLENSHAQTELRFLAERLAEREASVPGLKKNNEARILFARPESPAKTAEAFLYIHGFSASPMEVSPLAETIARERKANLLFCRLTGHGLEDGAQLGEATLEDWLNDTSQCLDFARQLGDQLHVIATSTGASLLLAEFFARPFSLSSMILISPHFGLKDRASELLLWPFGAWIARLVIGEYREWFPRVEQQKLYWTTRYPSQVLVEVMKAADLARKGPLESIRIPTLILYSKLDDVLNVNAIEAAFQRLGSPQKKLVEIQNPGDSHVIAGDLLSPRGQKQALTAIETFLLSLIKLP